MDARSGGQDDLSPSSAPAPWRPGACTDADESTMPARRRAAPGAQEYIPESPKATLPQLRAAANCCRGCDLYRCATQVVFGEGPRTAEVMLVGEQPGDREDLKGRPFVGPAGALLRQALQEARIDPAQAYLTNAVKHFKWTPAPKGKRRIHAKPNTTEIWACRPWLERELALIQPRNLVLMGATAAQSLLGSAFRVTRERGKPITGTPWAPIVFATVHPSSILRAPEKEDQERAYTAFVKDLKAIAKALKAPPPPSPAAAAVSIIEGKPAKARVQEQAA
jgi:DNA polymerase